MTCKECKRCCLMKGQTTHSCYGLIEEGCLNAKLRSIIGINSLAGMQVQDMRLNQQDNKLIACSCNNSFVGVWVVDLCKLAPFSRQSGTTLAAGTAIPGYRCVCLTSVSQS